MLILQQPQSHIPLYEADYEAQSLKREKQMEMHRPKSSLHLAAAPRASARLVDRQRFKLPAKPSVEIVRHDQRLAASQLISVSPFDVSFPSFPQTKELVVLFSVSPLDSRFPSFRLPRQSSPRQLPRPVSAESADQAVVSFSPFAREFDQTVAAASQFRRRVAPSHRRHRNRSAIKRRRLQAAMAQYRRERGPVQSRPVFDAETRKQRSQPVDPSIVSFSPWQEAEFAVHCKVPLPQFVHSRRLRAVTKQVAAILKPKLLKTKKPRFISYSPFSPLFPNFSKQPVKQLPLASKLPPTAVSSYSFPAYSPIAKQQPSAAGQFNVPAASKAAAVQPAAVAAKAARQPSLHMH